MKECDARGLRVVRAAQRAWDVVKVVMLGGVRDEVFREFPAFNC